jgi:glutamate 5-kinase
MPSSLIRQQVLTRSRNIVVKLGSQLLADPKGGVDDTTLQNIAAQVAGLMKRSMSVTLVSSGAIAVGRQALGMARRPKDIAILQGVAAVGQTGLMTHWARAFEPHGYRIGQILLTRSDFEDRARYLNLRNCIHELHNLNVVPIINENDTVAVDEIRLGDNDVLAGLVANALCADALVLLSVVEGVKDATGQPLEMIDDVSAAMGLVTGSKSALGTGGMGTKMEAARMVTAAGEAAVIASGRTPDVLTRIFSGEKVGTVFVPAKRRMAGRLRWIGHAVRPAGVIVVDDGAAKALADGRKSLLATGITEVVGVFEKGDVVVVRDGRGREIARGLINYTADETRTIMGKRSSQFEKLLGRRAYDEVIHRDHLVFAATSQESAS